MTARDQWISDKIAKLIAEGYSHEQAVAIAHSMWAEKQKRK